MLWIQEGSRSDNVGATAGACTLTWRRRLTRNASQFNPKFQLNRRCVLVQPERARRYRLRAPRPRALTGLDVLIELFDLIDEFSAELATDPPCQPTLAWVARRYYDGELRGDFGIFGDYLQAALRNV